MGPRNCWPAKFGQYGGILKNRGDFSLIGISLIIILSLSSFFILTSCASSSSSSRSLWPREQQLYRWQDAGGTSYWRREVGTDAQGHLTTKYLLYTPDLGPTRPVEKAVLFSEVGQIKGHLRLRPWRAQYRVWLEGQEYFAEQQLDPARRKIVLKLRSPRPEWNGTQEVDFPRGKVFCYAGQMAECLKGQGFLLTAIKQKAGRLNFHLVWEGYPFLQEQDAGLTQLFTPAIVEYDGQLGPDLVRFSVSFAGQVLFFVVNERGQLQKFFWVAQGISVEALGQEEPGVAAQVNAGLDNNMPNSPAVPSSGQADVSSSSVSAPPPPATAAPALRKLRWVGNPVDGNLSPSGR